MESVFLTFRPAMLKAVHAQFPKTCTACKRVFATLAEYLDNTQLLWPPRFDPVDQDERPMGVTCFANCVCGGTLGLAYEDPSRHAEFNAAVRAEALRGKREIDEVLAELLTELHQDARAEALMRTIEPDRLVRVRVAGRARLPTLVVKSASRDNEYTPLILSPHTLVLSGRVPLAESFVTKLSVQGAELAFWAKTESCLPAPNGSVEITLTPFAMDAQTQRTWIDLLENIEDARIEP